MGGVALGQPQEAGERWTKTVWCNSNRGLTKSFVDAAEAVAYANGLLEEGVRVVLRDYKARRRHVDRMAERYPDGPPGLRGR